MDHILRVSGSTGNYSEQKDSVMMEGMGHIPGRNMVSGDRALLNLLSEYYCGTYFVRTLEGFIHNLNSPLQILWIRSEQIRQDIQHLQKELQQADKPEIFNIVQRLQQRIDSLDKGMDDLNLGMNFLTKDIVTKRRSEVGPVHMNEVITDTVFLLKADMFFKHQVDVELALCDNLPKVKGRYSDFCIVALHLIQNALEALAQCDEEKRLIVETDRSEDGIVLQVRDTGNGISPEVGSHVFEPFFTTKEALEYNGQLQQHAGLGLCHVSHLLEPYHGKISFHSNPPETVFTVTLPAH